VMHMIALQKRHNPRRVHREASLEEVDEAAGLARPENAPSLEAHGLGRRDGLACSAVERLRWSCARANGSKRECCRCCGHGESERSHVALLDIG
jgi:hypothetical protein